MSNNPDSKHHHKESTVAGDSSPPGMKFVDVGDNWDNLSVMCATEYDGGRSRADDLDIVQKLRNSGRKPVTIDHYEVYGTLGSGATGKVKVAIDSRSDTPVAIKIIRKDKLGGGDQPAPERGLKYQAQKTNPLVRIRYEIYAFKKLSSLSNPHPYIVRLHEAMESAKRVFIIMEYVDGGSLSHYVKKEGHLQEEEVRRITQQIVCSLMHCHASKIAHRDLKPENILLSKDRSLVKLTDFGLVAIGLEEDANLRVTACGSPLYVAPEVTLGHNYDPRIADVYSLGATIYFMLHGRPPFETQSYHELYSLIREADKNVRFDESLNLSKSVKKLIRSMMKPNPQHRITLDLLWKTSWLQKDISTGLNVYLQMKMSQTPSNTSPTSSSPGRNSSSSQNDASQRKSPTSGSSSRHHHRHHHHHHHRDKKSK